MKARWMIWEDLDDVQDKIEAIFDDKEHHSHVMDFLYRQLDNLHDELARSWEKTKCLS